MVSTGYHLLVAEHFVTSQHDFNVAHHSRYDECGQQEMQTRKPRSSRAVFSVIQWCLVGTVGKSGTDGIADTAGSSIVLFVLFCITTSFTLAFNHVLLLLWVIDISLRLFFFVIISKLLK